MTNRRSLKKANSYNKGFWAYEDTINSILDSANSFYYTKTRTIQFQSTRDRGLKRSESTATTTSAVNSAATKDYIKRTPVDSLVHYASSPLGLSLAAAVREDVPTSAP